MERLGQRDLQIFLSYLREIYVHCDLESFADRAVLVLQKALPSDIVCYSEVDPQSRKIVPVRESVPDLAEARQALGRHIHEHPLVLQYQQTQDGQALKISDRLTQSQFRRLGLYNEFYRKMGVEHEMVAFLQSSPPLLSTVALDRSGKQDFTERERLLLNLLRPHLIQAYRNAESVTRIHQDAAHLKRTLEEWGRGVIALTEKNRLRWCTEQAQRWLAEYFEPSRRAEYLPESLQRWVEHQRLLLSDDSSDVPPPREPLILERPRDKRLAVRFVADPSEDRYLLLMEERRQRAPLSARSLQSLGLTRREAEILLLVARGKANKEIASALYVSPLTVRTHLEHIYRKLGVESRTEAVSRALEVSNLFS